MKAIDDHVAIPLSEIYFYLTEGCNLACRHCWISPKLQNQKNTYPTLAVELFQSILEQAEPLGLGAVKLTGGEPLMHPHIHDLLKIIKERDLSLCIETNGVLCTRQLAEEIASAKDPMISVSLDGADDETHEKIRGIKGCFSAALEGIKNLVNAGLRPQIIMTLMQNNKNQVLDIVALAESLGAGSVKFNIVQPTGRGEALNAGGETLDVKELLLIGKLISGTISQATNIKLHLDLPAAFQGLSQMFGKEGSGCTRCGIHNIIGVLANGSYALCGIGSHLKELIFGHAAEDRLLDVWGNHHILKEIREGMPSRFEGICGICHMKAVCNASCPAQNFYRTGSLLKPFWFCEEAYKKGLFPPTRHHLLKN